MKRRIWIPLAIISILLVQQVASSAQTFPYKIAPPSKLSPTTRAPETQVPKGDLYNYQACTFGFPYATNVIGPCITKTDSGESIEFIGYGTFRRGDKSATGVGTYTERNAAGVVTESGTWSASSLDAFYGFGDESIEKSLADGVHPPGPYPVEGGLAVVNITLTPISNLLSALLGAPAGRKAKLWVNCALGKIPPGFEGEWIRVFVEGGPQYGRESRDLAATAFVGVPGL